MQRSNARRNARRNWVYQLKQRLGRKGITLAEARYAARTLHELLTTSDAWEWMLIQDDDENKKELLKQITILMLHARKSPDSSLYLYLDKLFAVYYHVYIYKRAITHPVVQRLLAECRAESDLLVAFLNGKEAVKND